MILGIGTDITLISRISETWESQGERFLTRCFTAREADYILADPALTVARMAKRWAAKEAAAKALGCGIRGDVALKDFETLNDGYGCPVMTFHGGAAGTLNALAKGRASFIHVSLADDGDIAQAFVVLSLKSA